MMNGTQLEGSLRDGVLFQIIFYFQHNNQENYHRVVIVLIVIIVIIIKSSDIKIMVRFLTNLKVHQIIKEEEKAFKAHRFVKMKILMKLDVLFIREKG